MKQKSLLWMFAAILAICGTMTTLTSCSEKTDNPVPVPPSNIEDEEVADLLKGSWIYDIDGDPDVDFMGATYTFGDEGKVTAGFYYFDKNKDDYLTADLGFTYRALSSVQAGSRKLHQIIMSPTAETLKELHLDGSPSLTDTLFVEVIGKKLRLMEDVDEAEPYVYEGVTYDFATVFKRGTVDVSSFDKAKVKEFIAQIKKEMAVLEEQNAQQTRSASKAKTRFASSTGRDLSKWMKDIPGSTKVRDLMLPGSHDSGTYGLRGVYMTTFGKTQIEGLESQFDFGCRVFDLRTRSVKKNGEFDNYIFHDMMDCQTSLEDALYNIKMSLNDNPSEGVIITIKCEGNQVSNAINDFTDWLDENVYSKVDFLGKAPKTLLKEFMNKFFSNTGLVKVDYTGLSKARTTDRTVELVKNMFHGSGMLAQFKSDMTMDDLRGKALVILQDYETPHSGWEGLDDYIALSKNNKFFTPNEKVSVGVKEQNNWDQEEDQSQDAYVVEKSKQFKDMLQESTKPENADKWIVNACNGYFRDGGTCFPDYVTYASRTYPLMLADVETTPGCRGICILDYVGQEYVDHAYLLKVFTGWRAIKDFAAAAVGAIAGKSAPFIQMFTANYWAAINDCPNRNTNARQLMEAMIERNFTNGEIRNRDRQIIPTGGAYTKRSESYEKLFDDDRNTKWCVDEDDKDWNGHFMDDKIWACEFHTVAPVSPIGYTLYAGNNAKRYPKRNPRKWGLLAKLNKNDKWTKISWREYDKDGGRYAVPAEDLKPTKMIPFNADWTHLPKMQYFRFEVYSNLGDDYLQLSEFVLNYDD